MSGLAAISSVGTPTEIQLQYQTRVLQLQQDVLNMQGNMALQLIQSAGVPQETGQQLDVSA
ncbi:MAG: hypothetical protein HYV26_00125 [Candidatus Hydrogenedentes bacterium]|nr:hypothetical protein [Candidatus Hydrogenedentota bacterium]